MDRLLDLAESAISVSARQLCCREAMDCRSFARAAENLAASAQLQISEETLRQVVEAEGRLVVKSMEKEELPVDWSASQCAVQTPEGERTTRIYVSADGVMVPLTTTGEKRKRRATTLKRRRQRKRQGKEVCHYRPLRSLKKGADQRYKQFNVTDFYDQDQTHRLVSVTRKGHRGSMKLLRRDAARVRIRGADERIGLVDGAPALREQMLKLPLSALGLDFYHLSEHVCQAGREVLGEGNKEAKAWSNRMLHTVAHEGYEPFWRQLCDWRTTLRGKSKRHSADQLMNYVSRREEMIGYDEFRRRGWQIGTGPIESMCKNETLRVKGPGMRWDGDHAEGMMALEAVRQSNQWDHYWVNAVHCNN